MPAIIVTAWMLLAVFSTAQRFVGTLFTGERFALFDTLPYAIGQSMTWALLTPIVLLVVSRVPLRRGRVAVPLLALFATTLLIASAKLVIDYVTFPFFTPFSVPESGAALFRRIFVVRFYFSFLTAAIVAGLSLGLVSYDLFRDRELRARDLAARLAQAQLQVLEMQLNPHFLFNALQSIAELMHTDVDAADRMIGGLSDLLRVSLSRFGVHELPLREELAFLRQYLAIEEIRFSDRLNVEFDIDPAVLDAAVPNLVLQPLVENAVKHGIGQRIDGGVVRIAAHRRDSELLLEVADNGPGLRGAQPERLGLANTRARLEQLFDRRQSFSLHDDAAGGVRVELAIPFRLVES
jgi:signal transduction histidine kinase